MCSSLQGSKLFAENVLKIKINLRQFDLVINSDRGYHEIIKLD